MRKLFTINLKPFYLTIQVQTWLTNVNHLFVVTDRSKSIVASCSVYKLNHKKEWVLKDLYVDPFKRGKSMGNYLLKQAEELAYNAGADGLHLAVEPSNNLVIEWYARHGYEQTDVEWNIIWMKKKFVK